MKIDKKIIDNPLFYKWVYEPNDEINNYWKEYISNHPTHKKELLEIKEKFSQVKIVDERLTDQNKKKIASKIFIDLSQKEKPAHNKFVLKGFMRYAAVAVLFFSLGSLMVYLVLQNQLDQNHISHIGSIPQVNAPTLVLSEGTNINLEEKESSLDYSHKGQIVLNHDKVLQNDKPKSSDSRINQLIIPYGNRSKIKLSDNTTAWLNAGSRLIYPSEFEDDKREVLLFGEAFFEVAKDTERPFIVKTTDLTIKVLGTKFNISAYPDENVIQTVLAEGKIALRRNNAGFFEDDIIMSPQQMVWFNKKTNATKIGKVDVSYYTLWKDGLVKFSNQDLSRVIKQVERFYNISFKFKNPLDGNIKITGKLDLNEDQDEVLNYISKVALKEIIKTKNNQYVIK